MVAVIVERRRVLTPHNNGKPTFQQWICGDAVLKYKSRSLRWIKPAAVFFWASSGHGGEFPLGPHQAQGLVRTPLTRI